MITTIIFDIGNVLADFTWEAHYRSFGYSEEILERLANATVKNPLWNEYDRGVMSDEEIVQSFIERDPGIEKEIREALRDKGSGGSKRLRDSLDTKIAGEGISLSLSVQFFRERGQGLFGGS